MEQRSGTGGIRPTTDGRVAVYLSALVICLVVGLVTAQPALIAMGAVLVPVLVIGLVNSAPIRIAGRLHFDRDQVVEGDHCTAVLRLEVPNWAHCQVIATLPRGLALAPVVPGGNTRRMSALVGPGARPSETEWEIVAERWGRHTISEVQVEVRARGGLVAWRAVVPVQADLRVLPSAARVNELLAPAATRITHGSHLARRLVGDGSEFAELRPYQPGDRLRDLNWAATAKRRVPHVNRHHPELGGEVVLLVDTSSDGARGMSTAREDSLLRCTRAAWSIAQLHLNAQDRVGLLAHGQRTVWLDPKGGTRAKYQLLEALLTVSGASSSKSWEWSRHPADLIPTSALVLALTPLWDDRLVHALARLRARGRTVAVLALDPDSILGHPESADAATLHRLFAVSVATRRRALQRSGVPVVEWDAGAIEAALAQASHQQRARTRVGVGR